MEEYRLNYTKMKTVVGYAVETQDGGVGHDSHGVAATSLWIEHNLPYVAAFTRTL